MTIDEGGGVAARSFWAPNAQLSGNSGPVPGEPADASSGGVT